MTFLWLTPVCAILWNQEHWFFFFFILLLGFASSLLGFPRAQKETILNTQANGWKASVLSEHQQHLCSCYICQDPSKHREENNIWRVSTCISSSIFWKIPTIANFYLYICAGHISLNRLAPEFFHPFFCGFTLSTSLSVSPNLVTLSSSVHRYEYHNHTNGHKHPT